MTTADAAGAPAAAVCHRAPRCGRRRRWPSGRRSWPSPPSPAAPRPLRRPVGAALVLGFFAFGTLAVNVVAARAADASLLVALLTYTLQVVALALVFVALDQLRRARRRSSTALARQRPSSSARSPGCVGQIGVRRALAPADLRAWPPTRPPARRVSDDQLTTAIVRGAMAQQIRRAQRPTPAAAATPGTPSATWCPGVLCTG